MLDGRPAHAGRAGAVADVTPALFSLDRGGLRVEPFFEIGVAVRVVIAVQVVGQRRGAVVLCQLRVAAVRIGFRNAANVVAGRHVAEVLRLADVVEDALIDPLDRAIRGSGAGAGKDLVVRLSWHHRIVGRFVGRASSDADPRHRSRRNALRHQLVKSRTAATDLRSRGFLSGRPALVRLRLNTVADHCVHRLSGMDVPDVASMPGPAGTVGREVPCRKSWMTLLAKNRVVDPLA